MEHACELYHYGVPGMKWGVQKARKESRRLNETKRAYKSAKKHYRATVRRSMSPIVIDRSEAQRERRKAAVKYGEAKRAYKKQNAEFRKNAPTRVKVERATKNGAKSAAKTLAKIGANYFMDQTFNDGRGTKAAKAAVQTIGILSITAIARARGATDIHWYAKDGRKIV